MKFVIAQVLGVIGALIKIIAIQFDNKKKILIMFVLVNLIIGIELLLLKAYSGALVSLIAVIQTLINYIYCKKNKELPKFFVPIYIIVSLIIGFVSFESLTDILPIICAMLYVMSICQKREKNIRLITLISMCVWVVYNFTVRAYTDLAFKIIFIVSNLIAIYKYDLNKNYEKIGGK